ncbi:tRNA pseudouridine(38-40) synthase TruA [bacterium]|nr:tRNA pseudouridine(38-40) synthase TruA [bacterium]
MSLDSLNNYLLKVAYDGSKYYGWAIQPDRISVQGSFKEIFDGMFANDYSWSVAGRTDRGVHAMNQIVSVSIPIDFNEERFASVLNRKLPDSIYIKSVVRTNEYYDIRRKAKQREYRYFFNDVSSFSPFIANYRYFLNFEKMNFDKIQKAIPLFLGTRRFFNFSSSKKKVVNYERTVTRFKLSLKNKTGYFTIAANSFLYNMVRRIIGTLFLLGHGKIELPFIEELLNSKENMRTKTILIEPNGLYLWKVAY